VDQEGAVVSTVTNEGRLLLEYLSVCEFLRKASAPSA